MIAADTSSFIAYLQGELSEDATAVADAIRDSTLTLPPVVATELLADESADARLQRVLHRIAFLGLTNDYWLRAGRTRGLLIRKGFKARLGDALVAQACIDHDIPLIARDRDFRHFVKHCGLKLAL